jgi:hypothetical protein
MMTQREREWIDCHFTKISDQITVVRIEIAKLKVKSGMWGLLGGLIPVVIALSFYLAFRG